MTYREEDYGPKGLVQRVEIERLPDGTVTFRRFDGEGTMVEERAATEEEAAKLQGQERAVETERLRRSLTTVTAAVLATPVGQQIVSLLVATGTLSVEDALEAGWTPPSE